jgi:hypothetical protein
VTNANIVPFGKYKGQPVEVLAQDRPYLEWLSAQPWFRERYASMYTLIVNNFTEASETPDHNALQVLFLDDAFCLRFLRCYRPDIEQAARAQLQEILELHAGAVKGRIATERSRADSASSWIKCGTAPSATDWHRDQAEKSRAELLNIEAKIAKLEVELAERRRATIDAVSFHFERHFEVSGIDVGLVIRAENATHGIATQLYERYHPLTIELKPSVGDDYPAVLRQMRANKSCVLFIQDYIGVGATEEQFIKTFALSDIKVVFRRDVDAVQLADQSGRLLSEVA